MAGESNRPSVAVLLAAALLVAIAFLLNFYSYGKTKFYQNAPARIAADVRQMAASGSWLVPVTPEGEPRLDVAPLFLWSARVAHIFEDDLTRAVRIPAALCSLLLILLAAFWFFKHATRYSRDDTASAPVEGFAFLLGLMVATSPLLYSVSREGTPATLFALIYFAASFCWAESLEARRSFYAGYSPRFWMLWGYGFAGLGMLVAGPIILPLLWLPYLCAARAYRLRGFDPAHFLGVLISFVLSVWWPLAVTIKFSTYASAVWRAWLLPPVFAGADGPTGLLNWFVAPDSTTFAFLGHLLVGSLPWCVIAAVMLVRVFRREDRSPTLVYWTWMLLANLIVLVVAHRYLGGRLIMLPVIALLAADALYRWDFEQPWARVWRAVLRISIIIAIIIGIFIAALLSAPFWIVTFALIPVAWLIWVWHARRNDVTYTFWETTNRLAAMVLLIIFASLAMLLSQWERRLNFHRPIVAYFERVDDQLDAHDGPVYYLGAKLPGLYAFYADPPPRLITDLSQALPENGQQPIVFASEDTAALLADSRLEPLALLRGKDGAPPREVMLRLIKPQGHRAPYHLALLGNSGTRNKNQFEVGKRLNKAADKLRLQDALLLGNNIYGPSFFDHLNFIKSFEEPYSRLLRRGVEFHALLGHEDYNYPPLQLNYAPFNMDGQHYYSRELAGGLVEIFMLDAQALKNEQAEGTRRQLDWLEGAVNASRATWKIAALHPALLTAANKGKANRDLGELLLPLFDRLHINLVAWSGGFFYERSRQPGAFPLLLNAGWSGNWTRTDFRATPAHQAGYGAGVAGFVLLEFTSDTLGWRAITRRGLVVDEGRLARSGEILFSTDPIRPEPGAGRLLPADSPTTSTAITTRTTTTLLLAPNNAETTQPTLSTLDLTHDDAVTTNPALIPVRDPDSDTTSTAP